MNEELEVVVVEAIVDELENRGAKDAQKRMRPRIKVITLGVSDLARSLAFYRDGLGLPTQVIVGTEFEDGAVVFFEMNDDLILVLYPRTSLGIVLFSAAAGFVGKLGTGQIALPLAIALVVGAVPGAQLGSYVSKRVSTRALRGVLAALIGLTAVNMWWGLLVR